MRPEVNMHSTNLHTFELIVFDLDGTLIETAPEICDAVNDTLSEAKLAPATQAQIELWIGHGTRELLVQAVASSSALAASAVRGTDYFEQIASAFSTHYNRRCGTRSSPYPGAVEALEKLSAAGVGLAIVTNKEAAYTRRILGAHQLTERFNTIVCGDTLPTKKPSPEGVALCLAASGVSTSRALLVGDSSIDVATARNVGLEVWAFSHGYNMGQPIAASQPDLVLSGFGAFSSALGI